MTDIKMYNILKFKCYNFYYIFVLLNNKIIDIQL